MQKITSFLKANKIYILLAIIFVSFLGINMNVTYFGDDYHFLRWQKYDFAQYFNKLFEFYFKTNGRFIVHLLVTFFLKIPIIFWQIFNSLVLTRNMLLFF